MREIPPDASSQEEAETTRIISAFEQLPHVGQPLRREQDGSIAEQEIGMDNLVFIRADSFAPKATEAGIMLESAQDATQGEIERVTKHFTLNHRVMPNSGGGHGVWDNPPFLFVVPGSAMIAANGDPENLYPVDSFWAKSVELPAGSVIIHEQGNKPNLGDRESEYVLIERRHEESDTEILSRVLAQMGYTETKGTDRFSARGYENFDKAVTEYAAEHGIRAEPHEFSWSHSAEQAIALIAEGKHDAALGYFLAIWKQPGEADRMPVALKQSLIERICALPEPVPSEMLDAMAKKAERVLEREDIGDEDKELILSAVPPSVWQHIYGKMTAHFGGFDEFDNEEDARKWFQEMYGEPFQRLTGQSIDLQHGPDVSSGSQ